MALFDSSSLAGHTAEPDKASESKSRSNLKALPMLISSHCIACFDLFQSLRELLEQLAEDDHASQYQKEDSLVTLQDAFRRFEAWGSSIGAFKVGHFQSSLDYRLREAKQIRECILKVLQHLKRSLTDGELS